jgi:HlyD family secretion protein
MTTRSPRRWAVRALSVPVVATLSLLTLTACSTGQPPAPSATALVSRATISTGVSASGSLSAITTQDLGFAKGGQLKSVKVKVGDHVTEGQTLATIDTFALKQAVAQQQANVDQQEAVLNRLLKNPALTAGNRALSQAKAVLAATQHQVAVTATADRSAIHRAKKQLGVDEHAENQAEDARSTIKKACDASQADSTSAQALKALSDRYLALLQAGDTVGADAALAALNLALQSSAANASSSPCSAVISVEAGVTVAEQRVTASRTAVEAAKQKKNVDAASGQLLVENTRQAVVAAQNAVSATGSDRPFTLDQQGALVIGAQSLLDSAKRDLANATLKAPFAGTVSAINGTVGEFLSPSTATTALAPGSGAAIPGSDSAASAAAASRPGGAAFLVISNINRMQVVLPFEQSDAAEIVPKQKVSVGFDAVPDLTAQGTVSSVAPMGTAIAGVISYYVTVQLDDTDPRLKTGQTARATVATQVHTNVLSVPNDAVHQQGAQYSVEVVDPSGAQRTVAFQPGIVGPDRTEVLSGLDEGQRVVSGTGH